MSSLSRSQTPQQVYQYLPPGFTQHPQQQPPNPQAQFSHQQQQQPNVGPVLQNPVAMSMGQDIDPIAFQQRMQNASPQLFSPQQHQKSQAVPLMPAPNAIPPNMYSTPPQIPPQYGPATAPGTPGGLAAQGLPPGYPIQPGSQQAQQMQQHQMQRVYQMQMARAQQAQAQEQAHQAQMQAQAQAQAQAAGQGLPPSTAMHQRDTSVSSFANPQMSMSPGQIAAARQQQQQPQVASPGYGVSPVANGLAGAVAKAQSSPDAFVRGLQRYMATHGQMVQLNPVICGRQVHVLHLWSIVLRMGGFQRVSATNAWGLAAQHLSFPPSSFPMAATEVRDAYLRNLAPYEAAYLSQQHQKYMEQMRVQQTHPQMQQQAQQRMQQLQHQRQQSGQLAPTLDTQMSPSKGPFQHPGQQPGGRRAHPTPLAPSVNEVSTPQRRPLLAADSPRLHPSQQQSPVTHANLSPQVPIHPPSYAQPPTPVNIDNKPAPIPPAQLRQQPPLPDTDATTATPATANIDTTHTQPKPPSPPNIRHPIEDPFKPIIVPESHSHGPIIVDDLFFLGEEISRLKPHNPGLGELGVIDLHALTMGIRSGIHGEMRVALDTLATVSGEAGTAAGMQILLDNCPDLVDALIECGEDQVELLTDNSTENDVTEEQVDGWLGSQAQLQIPSYEEVLRGCSVEMGSLMDCPEVGSLDYELNRATDRLICITTILRNFSFVEMNATILSAASVVRFVASIIQYFGTKNLPFRTNQNTLDLMKDLLLLLSNLGHTLRLPGKDETLYILEFLLAFAPGPLPFVAMRNSGEEDEEEDLAGTSDTGRSTASKTASGADNSVMFTPYQPNIHRYLPFAVDALAKILARDDPNRSYFKAIFAADAASVTANMLSFQTAHHISASPSSTPSSSSSSPSTTTSHNRLPPPLLMTRAFGLVISSLPSPQHSSSLPPSLLTALIDLRKPLLTQGLLAADILSSMVQHGSTAYAWFSSIDGWASSLLRIVSVLCGDVGSWASPYINVTASGIEIGDGGHDLDDSKACTLSMLTRGLAILRQLAEKMMAMDGGGGGSHYVSAAQQTVEDTAANTGAEQFTRPTSPDHTTSPTTAAASHTGAAMLPAIIRAKRESVLAALLSPSLDTHSVKQLSELLSIGGLD